MPPGNQFRHQECPTSPFHLLPTACPTDPSSAEFGELTNLPKQLILPDSSEARYDCNGRSS